MMKISLDRFQRTSAGVLLDLVPFIVIGRPDLAMRVTKCFERKPGVARITRDKSRRLPIAKWKKLLVAGPVLITVDRSPWFLVEKCDV